MKIFGITVVKNEADIIAYSLGEASKWATRIFVLDNGSIDGTWEAVNELARTNEVIVPWKQTSEPFTEWIRALVFNEFRHLASEEDWWCMRLDADEFYIDDPRTFLRDRVKSYYNVVCSKSVQYQLTDADLASLPFALEVPDLISRLKYFSPVSVSEIRFFRHRKRLQWLPGQEVPRLLGMISPERIMLRHYQYRSPQQVRTRIATRIAAKRQRDGLFMHVKSTRMEDYIAKAADCIIDERDVAVYNRLPLAYNQDLTYSWWKFWIYRILRATKVLT